MYIVVSREVYADGSSETYCYTIDTEGQLETIKEECRYEDRKVLDFNHLEDECALSEHGDKVIVIFSVDEETTEILEHSDVYEGEDEIIVVNGVRYKRIG
jgi:hypothetical protein